MESGWLIEYTESRSGSVEYFGRISSQPQFGRTTESIDAIRFSRQRDAEDAAVFLHLKDVKVTEHSWSD